jgi:hypothetical protein
MTKESCVECLKPKSIMCVDIPEGRVMSHLPDMKYIVIQKPVRTCPLKESNKPILGETMEEVNRWFELEGKTDTMNLGS